MSSHSHAIHVDDTAANTEARDRRSGPRKSGVALALALLSTSCASETQATKVAYPHSSDRMCRYVGLEAVSTDQHETADSVTLLAVYRFSTPNVPAPREPLSLKFQVARSRVDDLRGHLEAHPEVICHPDKQSNYEVQLEPFSGIQGEPQP